ncbi:hypothetical protein D3C72_2529940 [compost metagenome]
MAEATKTKYIDIRGAFLEHPDFTRFICVDGIHPNRDGHRIISERVLEFIREHYGSLLQDHGELAPG